MIEEFLPVPQVGHRYVTNDKRLLTVKSIVDSDGVILVHALDIENEQFEFNASQWNELGLSDIIQVNNRPISKKEIEDEYQKNIDDINQRRSEGKALKWKCGIINELLWTCAGVDSDLLRTCKHDWAKHAGVGGTILGTAVLAALSGGYAIYTILDSSLISTVIGILWGLVVLNLDRYLVNSMCSNEKSTISIREFMSGLPRILIALFTGVLIAIPIALTIFKGAINDYIQEENINRAVKSPEVIAIENKNKALHDEIVALDYYIQSSQKELTDEINGSSIKGYGPIAHKKETDIFKTKERIDYLHHISDSLINQRNDIVSKASYIDNPSLSQRIKVLYVVTEYKRNGKLNSLFFIRIFIYLQFVLLELLPILNKMMTGNGMYESLINLESETFDKLLRIKNNE